MAEGEHVALLRQGVAAWNTWRRNNPNVRPVLDGASLCGADLHEADLGTANLFEADLRRANLFGANLRGADLSHSNLSGETWTMRTCVGQA